MAKWLLIFFVILTQTYSSSVFSDASSKSSMNGYTQSQFGDFTKEWHLVTVRFRKDSGEQRFTYANEAAWKTLSANRTDYPDGAVFAKIGIKTQPDPDFESSTVPSGTRRVQFMVRNAKLHASTDGWGYALFDDKGEIFPEDVKVQSMACAACHRLVPHRGYVFSQPMNFGVTSVSKSPSSQIQLKFVDRSASNLPEALKKYVKTTSLRIVKSPLTKNVFFGTLDEVRPLLSKEVAKTKKPAAFVSDNGSQFSVVILDPNASKCKDADQVALKSIHTLTSSNPPKVHEASYCHSLAL